MEESGVRKFFARTIVRSEEFEQQAAEIYPTARRLDEAIRGVQPPAADLANAPTAASDPNANLRIQQELINSMIIGDRIANN